ncbi:hypothetical protein Sjap_012050 [Stephania japonica]|uniref:Uncharacterized protein n=1 Tax=Stephania japonica TaxID=461633 RepID=A0AAP0JCP0_9MAGN
MPLSFLLVSSSKRLSCTMDEDKTPPGAELLRDTTKVSQLSGNELKSKSACNSSLSTIFIALN